MVDGLMFKGHHGLLPVMCFLWPRSPPPPSFPPTFLDCMSREFVLCAWMVAVANTSWALRRSITHAPIAVAA